MIVKLPHAGMSLLSFLLLLCISPQFSQAQSVNSTEASSAPLDVTITQTSFIKCRGDATAQLQTVTSGGVAPYTYSWYPSGNTSPNPANLPAANYTLTVKDAAGTTIQKQYLVRHPDEFYPGNSGVQNVSCNGGGNGAIYLHLAGGTPPYSYNWAGNPTGNGTPSVSGLSAGNYTCNVTDANACTYQTSFTINQPPALSADVVTTNATPTGVTDGSAKVTVSGGTPPYRYLWVPYGGTSSTASGLGAGNFTVAITDANNCQYTKDVSIGVTQPAFVTSVAVPRSKTYKNGDVLSFSVNFSAGVKVTGLPAVIVYIGFGWRKATYVSGSGTNTLLFEYTISDGDSDMDGIALGTPIDLYGGSITNEGINSDLALVNVGNTSGVLVDASRPVVNSISLINITPTNAAFVSYTVTFSEPVKGVDLTDFTLTSVGTVAGNITFTTGTGNSYTVTVGNLTGQGQLRLDLNSTGTGITDEAGNPVDGGFTRGSAYTIDRVAPDAPAKPMLHPAYDSGPFNNDQITNRNTLIFTGTQAEPNSTVTLYTGIVMLGFAKSDATGNWTITVGTMAEGTWPITAKVTDAVGNVGPLSPVSYVTIDNTAPGAPVVVTPANGAGIYNNTPDISGTAETGTITDVFIDGVLYHAAATPDATGNWLYKPTAALSEGSHTIKARSMDLAGNVSAESNTNTFLINTQPTITVSGSHTTMSTVYPLASVSDYFAVSGINLSEPILITAPAGFELSINNSIFAPFLNFSSQTNFNNVRIYYRMKARINTGNYTGDITLSSTGAVTKQWSVQNWTVTPKPIQVTAIAATKVYGTPDPLLLYDIVPALEKDDYMAGALDRGNDENTGTYPITKGSLDAGPNYAISFTGNDFTITKAPQTITWNQSLVSGCDGATSIQLTASTSSSLPLTYSLADPAIATITGNTLTPLTAGSTTITVTQDGDRNHFAAAPVVNTYSNQLTSAIRQHWNNVVVFDNTGGTYTKWQWYKNGSAINGAVGQYYSEATALNGTYFVMATDKNGRTVQSCPVTLTGSGAQQGGIKVFANPAKAGSMINVTCNYSETALQGARIQVSTLSGTVVQQLTTVRPVTQLQAPAAGGLYIITLTLNNGQKVTTNVVVK